jgi:hypothetical protein
MKKSFKAVLALPVALWVLFQVVALVMGFTQTVSTSVEILFGDMPVFFAVLFGLWIGRRTFKAMGDYLYVAMLNGLIASLVVGFVAIMFILLLAYYSPSFIQSYGTISASSGAVGQSLSLMSVIGSGVGSWVKMVLVTIVSAALGLELFSRK